MAEKPKMHTSEAQKELQKVEKQFDAFDQNLKEMASERLDAPKKENEPIHKLSQDEIDKSKEVYLKPHRTIGSPEKFNEDYREDYNFAKEYVRFIPENREIIGETIELWTKPFAGVPAEFWKVPCGKPVWGPRYLAEQITRARYHRFVMQQAVQTGFDEKGNSYFGSMAVDTVIQRLDAIPVSERKSIFMGARTF